jgi:hypothetical protein
MDEDLGSLAADFSRLRGSIAAELRRVGHDVAVASVPPPPPESAAMPPQPPVAPAEDDIPSFYQLRENLVGGVSSALGAAPPPKSVPLKSPQRPPSNTVSIARQSHPQPGMEPTEAALTADFESLHASLTSKLRNAAWEGIRAAERRAVTGSPAQRSPTRSGASAASFRAVDDDEDDEGGFSAPPPPSVVARQQGATAQAAAADIVPNQEAPTANTVMLSARKPGAPGGPTVLAALDHKSAVAACKSHAPTRSSSAPTRVPLCVPSSLAHETPDAVSSAATHKAKIAATPSVSLSPTRGDNFDSSTDVMFGHLAMRAALRSHRSHYEKSRNRLRGRE